MNTPRRVEVGRLGAAHGVRGWLRVQSFTDPPQRLFEWKRWCLRSPDEGEQGVASEVKLLEARQQGNGWIARLEGIDEREAASRLTGHLVLVDREELPPTEGREHYRADLVGFAVMNLDGVLLGVVDHFLDTPANAVMVVKGEREHWIPVTKQHLLVVNQGERLLTVDWPEDF